MDAAQQSSVSSGQITSMLQQGGGGHGGLAEEYPALNAFFFNGFGKVDMASLQKVGLGQLLSSGPIAAGITIPQGKISAVLLQGLEMDFALITQSGYQQPHHENDGMRYPQQMDNNDPYPYQQGQQQMGDHHPHHYQEPPFGYGQNQPSYGYGHHGGYGDHHHYPEHGAMGMGGGGDNRAQNIGYGHPDNHDRGMFGHAEVHFGQNMMWAGSVWADYGNTDLRNQLISEGGYGPPARNNIASSDNSSGSSSSSSGSSSGSGNAGGSNTGSSSGDENQSRNQQGSFFKPPQQSGGDEFENITGNIGFTKDGARDTDQVERDPNLPRSEHRKRDSGVSLP